MAKQRPGFIIAGEPDTERTKCHTACKCREAKVEELVTKSQRLLNEVNDLTIMCVRESGGNTNAAVLKLRRDELQAAIEGVKI